MHLRPLVIIGIVAVVVPILGAFVGPANPQAPSGNCGVWNGKIARLRVYDQPGSTGKKVFAYKAPGTNSDYVGNSDDSSVVHALFLARDNNREIRGTSNNTSCRIELVDY